MNERYHADKLFKGLYSVSDIVEKHGHLAILNYGCYFSDSIDLDQVRDFIVKNPELRNINSSNYAKLICQYDWMRFARIK